MPSIFKALATITVWILFVTGCLAILTTLPIPLELGAFSRWRSESRFFRSRHEDEKNAGINGLRRNGENRSEKK